MLLFLRAGCALCARFHRNANRRYRRTPCAARWTFKCLFPTHATSVLLRRLPQQKHERGPIQHSLFLLMRVFSCCPPFFFFRSSYFICSRGVWLCSVEIAEIIIMKKQTRHRVVLLGRIKMQMPAKCKIEFSNAEQTYNNLNLNKRYCSSAQSERSSDVRFFYHWSCSHRYIC